jgi:hypothetical protein
MKIITATVALILATLGLAACGGSVRHVAAQPPAQSTQPRAQAGTGTPCRTSGGIDGSVPGHLNAQGYCVANVSPSENPAGAPGDACKTNQGQPGVIAAQGTCQRNAPDVGTTSTVGSFSATCTMGWVVFTYPAGQGQQQHFSVQPPPNGITRLTQSAPNAGQGWGAVRVSLTNDSSSAVPVSTGWTVTIFNSSGTQTASVSDSFRQNSYGATYYVSPGQSISGYAIAQVHARRAVQQHGLHVSGGGCLLMTDYN